MCRDDYFYFFFFNDTATTEIYTLSLHDALPISFLTTGKRERECVWVCVYVCVFIPNQQSKVKSTPDRKSTRLNSSHANISYAVFCLKKKKNNKKDVIEYSCY